jgi:Glycosyltransferase family 10 (fucosyltransferase) C-term
MISIVTIIDKNIINNAVKADNPDNTNTHTIDTLFDKSITSIMNQTFKDWELKIILYNISHEKEITNNININQIYKEIDDRIETIEYNNDAIINTPSKAFLNIVKQHCKYNYIAVLNINDEWMPNKLEIQKNIILKHPQIDILGSKSQYKNEISNIPEGELYNINLLKVNPFINSTVIIKKDILKHLDDQNTNENRNEINMSLTLNYLWVKSAIFQCVLYNLSDITVTHNDVKPFEHYKQCYEKNEFKNSVKDLKSKYIRVKIMSDYCVPEHCKKEYERSCLVKNIDYYGKTKKIYFTTTETYTHAILLNCPIVQNLQVNKNNVVGFAQEPHDTPFLRIYQNNFIDYAVKNIGKYFIGSVDKFPKPTFVGHHGFLFYETPKTIPFRPQKPKLMSIMVSHKSYTPGHQYRHIIVQHILKHNIPIDIWGNGCEIYKQKFPNNTNIKGGFKSMEEMCKDYLFTIAIENTSHDHYFTEKIINPFINNTIPIYWGCKKVEEYFPKHTIHLTGNINRDIIIIHTVLKNPNKYLQEYKIDQDMVLNKVNLVKNIERIFDI